MFVNFKHTMTRAAVLVASLGTVVMTATPVFAENPDNNSTSLKNQDLGGSTAETTTTTTTTQTQTTTTETTTAPATTETTPEKLPETGANDSAIAGAMLLLAGGAIAVTLPRLRQE